MAPIDLMILAQEICKTFFLHTDYKNKKIASVSEIDRCPAAPSIGHLERAG